MHRFQTSLEEVPLTVHSFDSKMATVVILKIQEQVYCIKGVLNMGINYRCSSIK